MSSEYWFAITWFPAMVVCLSQYPVYLEAHVITMFDCIYLLASDNNDVNNVKLDEIVWMSWANKPLGKPEDKFTFEDFIAYNTWSCPTELSSVRYKSARWIVNPSGVLLSLVLRTVSISTDLNLVTSSPFQLWLFNSMRDCLTIWRTNYNNRIRQIIWSPICIFINISLVPVFVIISSSSTLEIREISH